MAHALRFPPIAVVVRALDNPRLNACSRRLRTSTGNTRDPSPGRAAPDPAGAGQNKGVAILIDQHIQTSEAVVVDFFNRPAATTSAVAALALRTGAPVDAGVRGAAARRPLPDDLRASGEPPPADDPDAIREFTQRCTDVLEMYVRRYPNHWLWMHRRWRDAAARRGRPGHVPGRSARG